MDDAFYTNVISAAPGWHVCEPVSGDNGIDGLDLLPVLAWVVAYDVRGDQGDVVATWAHPVVADVVLTTSTEGPILRRPDGRFVVCEVGEFETEAGVIQFMRERAGQAVAQPDSRR